jgi:hypothetical protein
MKRKNENPPQIVDSKLPPHPQPSDPDHEEWVIDEAEDESFPASDPSSVTQPHKPSKEKSRRK